MNLPMITHCSSLVLLILIINIKHCVKSVQIQNRKNFVLEHFSRSEMFSLL